MNHRQTTSAEGTYIQKCIKQFIYRYIMYMYIDIMYMYIYIYQYRVYIYIGMPNIYIYTCIYCICMIIYIYHQQHVQYIESLFFNLHIHPFRLGTINPQARHQRQRRHGRPRSCHRSIGRPGFTPLESHDQWLFPGIGSHFVHRLFSWETKVVNIKSLLG